MSGTITTITSRDAVNALVVHDLTDDQLDALIAREEARLLAAVGHPSAERTKVYDGNPTAIFLPRAPLAVASIVQTYPPGGIQRYPFGAFYNYPLGEYQVIGSVIYHTYGFFFGPVAVTWTPIDFTPQFTDAVIELVRLRISRRGYAQEHIGSEWRYIAPTSWEDVEQEIIGGLMAPGNSI